MRLGIDFDNTIACYDALFHRVALEDGVIPADLPANKSDVRNHLRATGREPIWTAMQGTVYGARMAEAAPYPGVLDFFRACRTSGIEVFIVSHKTRHPFAGPPHDLHAAARNWLEQQGFFDPAGIALPREDVHFELTKQEKLARIAACRCTHFIDDLPEILAEPAFPGGVHPILFDPHDLYRAESRFSRVTSWAAVARHLSIPVPDPAAPPDAAVAAFLRDSGIPAPENLRLSPLPGGANNQVFALSDGMRDYVLKRYFHAEGDPRDRFGAEHAFYTWSWSQGIRQTPQPLAWSRTLRLGLFERIHGRKLAAGEPDASHIAQAVAFVSALNASRHSAPAHSIPAASESCFSITTHLDRIDRRVARLSGIPADSRIDREAAGFVRDELAPAWRRIRAAAKHGAGRVAAHELPTAERCLSPSDFGFHNALVDGDGCLRFLDFEYAGWDDPAKLAGDFFSQPRVPVDLSHWDAFVGPIDAALGWNGRLDARARLLLPAYRLKWCCILLNEFLPMDRARRTFAAGQDDRGADAERKHGQLHKARQALAGIPEPGF